MNLAIRKKSQAGKSLATPMPILTDLKSLILNFKESVLNSLEQIKQINAQTDIRSSSYC